MQGARRQAGPGEDEGCRVPGQRVEQVRPPEQEPCQAGGRPHRADEEHDPAEPLVGHQPPEEFLGAADEPADPDHGVGKPPRVAEDQVEGHRSEDDSRRDEVHRFSPQMSRSFGMSRCASRCRASRSKGSGRDSPSLRGSSPFALRNRLTSAVLKESLSRTPWR